MKLIAPNNLQESVIDLIGKEWMLVSAGNAEGFNSMTASWGSIGYQFNCNVATIVVRPERYTYEFIENSTHFTLTILAEGHRDALMVMGRNSGRDCDKVAKSGLTPCFTPSGNPTYKEARIVLECRKIYAQMMDAEAFIGRSLIDKWYDDTHGNLHKMYMGEIENCWIAE
ncbi:MAG: flavin reductase [Rikenellaceae bacterium]